MDLYRASTGGHAPAWGPPTSTLNFCEEDYQFTPYVAELFNTLTNITYIALGIHGILTTRQYHLRQSGLGPYLPFIALINLGIASSIFHSSLKYATQMLDEFSMLIATFTVFYRLLNYSQTRISDTVLRNGLYATFYGIIVAQIWTGSSTVQQVVFTACVYGLWRECFKCIRRLEGKEEVRKGMRRMAISGIAFFVTGHLCWMTDFYACDNLRSTRHQIGMPWAGFLELHGFWHIFTGIGVYIFMNLVEMLRSSKEESEGLRLNAGGRWPFMVFLERVEGKKEN